MLITLYNSHFRYEEAIHVLTKEMSYHVAGENPAAMGRVLVAVVMVIHYEKIKSITSVNSSLGLFQLHLVREDPIAASKAIQEWGGSGQHEEVRTTFIFLL